MKQDLVDELRKKLQNNLIALDIAITKTETQTKVFKPSDVFKNMIEKNPALLEMKKRFDLEIDY